MAGGRVSENGLIGEIQEFDFWRVARGFGDGQLSYREPCLRYGMHPMVRVDHWSWCR